MSSGRFTRVDERSKGQAFDWPAIERSSEFKELVTARKRVLVPLTIAWLVGALGYLLLAAFAPGVMSWQVVDGLPFAWLAALSQVFLTWAITFIYLRKADHVLEPLEQRAAAVAEREVEGSVR
jgi:uncharacterized membrane protein (DUF485 family)